VNDRLAYDAAEALAAVDEARTTLLQRVEGGSWRHDLIYSALAAASVMAQALPPPSVFLADAAVVVGFLTLARWQRARTGVSISCGASKRARWGLLTIGVLAGAAAIAVNIAARQGQPTSLALALGPAVGLIALGGSRLRRRIFRAEVGAGVAPESTGRRNWNWPIIGLGLVSGLVAGVLAFRGEDSYLVGLFAGAGLSLMASPGLFMLKRRILLR
jgi:hypothetical protein